MFGEYKDNNKNINNILNDLLSIFDKKVVLFTILGVEPHELFCLKNKWGERFEGLFFLDDDTILWRAENGKIQKSPVITTQEITKGLVEIVKLPKKIFDHEIKEQYKEDLFAKLNIKPYETFRLKTIDSETILDDEYYVNDRGAIINATTDENTSIFLKDIIDKFTIIKAVDKIETIPEDKIIINFVKLNGFKYLSRDKHNNLIAFKTEPSYDILGLPYYYPDMDEYPHLIPCPENMMTHIKIGKLTEIEE